MKKSKFLKMKYLSEDIKLNRKNVALFLLELMKNHIGKKRSISKSEIFEIIFDTPLDDTLIEHWLRWQYVKSAMHLLRSQTKCFIAFYTSAGEYFYFVVNSLGDTTEYVNRLDSMKKQITLMKNRCIEAGKKRWGSKEWILSDNNSKGNNRVTKQ